MALIAEVQIGTNRYAPEGSAAIRAYEYNGAEGLSLGQLVMAICIRRAAYVEKSSVLYMNMMTDGTNKVERLAELAEQVLAGAGDWPKIKAELEDLGCTGLPANVATYTNRMTAYEAVQTRLTTDNATMERQAVELQTTVGRRDAVFSISSNTVRHMGQTALSTANTMNT